MISDRNEILAQHSLVAHIEQKGARLIGSSPKLRTNSCPISNHSRHHYCVEINVDERPQLWHCHDHKQGGTIVDWIAHEKGVAGNEVFKELAQGTNGNGSSAARKPAEVSRQRLTQQNSSNGHYDDSEIVEIYPYTDEIGRLVFEAVRLTPDPKTGKKRFRQRHKDRNGKIIWNLEGVTRTIFQLPEVLKSPNVAVAEGEKDALTITKYGRGVIGTCNPMGAGKWLEAYNQYFAKKNVWVFQDNDTDGPTHADTVARSVVHGSNSLKRPQVPMIVKDITEFLELFPEEQREDELAKLFKEAVPIKEAPPVYLIHEFEEIICQDFKRNGEHYVDLGKFLPSVGDIVGEPLQQGDLAVFLGDVGFGKTTILQQIALSVSPLPTLFFEMELGKRLLFIRTIQQLMGRPYREVYNQYKHYPDERHADAFKGLHHMAFCWRSGLTPDQLEEWICNTELKFGEPVVVVCVDYIGLINAKGKSRYEQVSKAAEKLKEIACNTNTIILAASQIHRKNGGDEDQTREIHLHDARDSGSIEASAQLLMGCYRSEDNPRTRAVFKVLKNTKGFNNIKSEVDFDGKTMRFSEPPKQPNLSTRQSYSS